MADTIDITQQDPRWAQVVARNRSADGSFVYAVKTTGVFCRPSCPARPAKPQNVVLYDTCADAEAAGFRACLRCRPLASDHRDPMTASVETVAAYIRAHADEPLPLSRLAAVVGVSPYHLQRSFKAVLGISPKDYQAAERLMHLKARLRSGDSVLSATFDAGYGSTSRMYAHVEGGLGMTPSAYRAGAAGEIISFATRTTALGLLMMAATERGVCFVQFGDSAAALQAQLIAEFPRAQLEPTAAIADGLLADWMVALDDHLTRGGPQPDVPLDLRGTAFQLRVWRFLLTTRPGDVVSYSELAERIDAKPAVRAAASACGANRIAVLVPCHRVLRADGGLGGYRWGVERKRALLDAERRTGASRHE